ncbi:MAG: GNAT family protein [Candidatus Cloacimonetes bacterium]|nr:GNAT family protein [Candidatus Cloacimonadota bacterium]
MRILETTRLLLKPVEEEDLPKLLDLQWDKDVVQHMKFTPLSMDDQKSWLKSLGKNRLAFMMLQKNEGQSEFIGLATLNNIDHVNQRASWGMKLKSNLVGKGIGYEASLMMIHYAFHFLNMNKVHADYIEDNSASDGLVKKIGLRQEGLLVKHLFHRGKFHDLVLVGILKDDFYVKNGDKLVELGLM